MNLQQSREMIAKEYEIDLSLVKQVFFISLKNDSWVRYVGILEDIGDFKANTIYADNKKTDFVYVNTNLTLDELEEKFNSLKPKKSKITIKGMTLDLMMLISDNGDREWCYERQKQTMDYIISKQQPKAFEIMNNLFDYLEEKESKEDSNVEKE